MNNKKEEYRSIKDYPDYQVSNKGNVKSFKAGKERILKPGVTKGGYLAINLCKDKKSITKKIHKLVSIAFLGHIPSGMDLVINHINHTKDDNRVENLEIVTSRENTNKKHLKSSSKYTGVCWNKRDKKWQSNITINGSQKHLGLFIDELEASKAYQNALKSIPTINTQYK
tara:strand:- start:503 stop:1012 length:510 start_codon:yes stop_codon:yes gene_type:complete